MDENPFGTEQPPSAQSSQEKFAPRIELATEEDWRACKDLRILSITGPDAEMYGLTPEKLQEEKDKDEKEWRKESWSGDMFSVLSWNGSEAIGLGRAKRREEGVWRIRNGYVKPEFRNRGIQQKMLALRLHEIQKQRGGTKAITGIRIDNSISLHVAEKFGFKVVETDNGWYMMELDLTNPGVVKKINDVLNAG